MGLVLISAMSLNRVIGRDGGLPWSLPDDMKHFKQTTMGSPVIMGRRTFETDAGVLPGRLNIVITRDNGWTHDGVEVARSIEQARGIAERAEPEKDAFVIGGGVIYGLALPLADRLELTTVHALVEGDTFFPPVPAERWSLASARHHPADERHAYAMTFQTLLRRL